MVFWTLKWLSLIKNYYLIVYIGDLMLNLFIDHFWWLHLSLCLFKLFSIHYNFSLYFTGVLTVGLCGFVLWAKKLGKVINALHLLYENEFFTVIKISSIISFVGFRCTSMREKWCQEKSRNSYHRAHSIIEVLLWAWEKNCWYRLTVGELLR